MQDHTSERCVRAVTHCKFISAVLALETEIYEVGICEPGLSLDTLLCLSRR